MRNPKRILQEVEPDPKTFQGKKGGMEPKSQLVTSPPDPPGCVAAVVHLERGSQSNCV